MDLNKDKEITFGKTLFFQVTEQPKPPQTSKPGRYCFRGKFYTKVLPINSKNKKESVKFDLAKSQRTSRQTPKFRIKSSDSSDYNQSLAERYEQEMKINKLVLLPKLHRRIKSQYDSNLVQKNNNLQFKLSPFESSETQNTFEKELRQNKKLINFKRGSITFDEKAKELDQSNDQQSLDTSFNTFSEIKSKSNRYSNQAFLDNVQRKQQELKSAKTLSEEQRSYLLNLKRQYQHLKFQFDDEKVQSDFETEQEKSQGQGRIYIKEPDFNTNKSRPLNFSKIEYMKLKSRQKIKQLVSESQKKSIVNTLASKIIPLKFDFLVQNKGQNQTEESMIKQVKRIKKKAKERKKQASGTIKREMKIRKDPDLIIEVQSSNQISA